MQYLQRFYTAAGAFIRAAAAVFIKFVKAVIAWFAKVNDTYRGYVNIPELVSVLLVALASGDSLEMLVKAIATHTGTIFVNVDSSTVGQWTTILMAIAGILHRLSSGQKIPPPSARQSCPRTMR